MLNYTCAIATVRYYPLRQNKIWLSSIQCPSDATTLDHCYRSGWGSTEYCDDWTVGLICHDPKGIFFFFFFLTSSIYPLEKRIHVKIFAHFPNDDDKMISRNKSYKITFDMEYVRVSY